MEDNDLINTIQELRLEGVLQFAEHLTLHTLIVSLISPGLVLRLLEAHRSLFIEQGCTDIRGHDNDRIAEVYRTSFGISQLAIFKDLEKHVEDIGMSLFDFIEQDHTVGFTAYRLSQLATFLVTDVSGRCPDQTSRGMALHKLGHVDFDQGLFAPEHKFGKRLGQFGLTDTRWTHEDKGAIWPFR